LGVRTGHTEEVLEMVLRAEAHIGIGRPIRHPDVELIPLFEDEMLLVVAARHPFASRGTVSMAALAEARLILFDRTSSYHELTSPGRRAWRTRSGDRRGRSSRTSRPRHQSR